MHLTVSSSHVLHSTNNKMKVLSLLYFKLAKLLEINIFKINIIIRKINCLEKTKVCFDLNQFILSP